VYKNVRYKLLGFVLCTVFLMSLAGAQVQTLKAIQQNTCKLLPQSYANSTWHNITYIDISGEVLTINDAMTAQGGGYFTYNFCNTSKMGEAIVNGIGDVDGVLTTWQYNTFITADGNELQDLPYPVLFLIIGLILIVVGEYLNNIRIITYVGAVLVMITGVLTLYPGYNYINHSNLIGLSIGTVSIGVGFFFLLKDSFSDPQREYYSSEEGEND